MSIINNLVQNKLHPITGEDLRPTIVSFWRDGSAMTDAKCGGMYNKDTEPTSPSFGAYFKWNSAGSYPISRLTTINQSNFQKLLNDFGSSEAVILIDRNLTLTSNLSVPVNINLEFSARINIPAGVTITIANEPISNRYIFEGLGAVSITKKCSKSSVMWFGATGDGTTDETAAFASYASFCKLNATMMRIPEGRFLTGRVDITGIKTVKCDGTLYGKPGEDVLYWKSAGESGYVAPDGVLIDANICVDGSVDVRSNELRIGFGGERIGNAAIVFPHNGYTYNFGNINIFDRNSPTGFGTGYGHTGIFWQGQAYKVTFGKKTEIRNLDYGIIVGTSAKTTEIKPYAVSGIDATTNTFSLVNTFVANYQVALLYDANLGTLPEIISGKQMYIVNPTGTTFQLALTASGSPIDFSVTGTPTIYVVPTRDSANDYANDEWSATKLICVARKVGLSVANMGEANFNSFVCQSTRVFARILAVQMKGSGTSNNVCFNQIYNEGPFDAAYMSGKEYGKFEGSHIRVLKPIFVSKDNYLTLNINKSDFNGFTVGAGTGAVILSGDNNILRNAAFSTREAAITDKGVGNMVYLARSGNGSETPRFQNFLHKKTINKSFGGMWPDYLVRGSSVYQSDSVLFHPASSAKIVETDTELRFDDSSLDVNGYLRRATLGNITIANPLGSTGYSFLINSFFPKGKWRLYAKVRSLTGANSIRVKFQQVGGFINLDYESVVSVGTSWTVISVDCDHTTAPDGFNGQIYVRGITEGLDLAYFQIVPFSSDTLSTKINFGGGTIDGSGAVAPEGQVIAAVGSTYRVPGVSGGLYIKMSGTGNTGWQIMNIKPSAASADTATSVGVVYSQSEVQAIITELRDLKAKMRTAGILS